MGAIDFLEIVRDGIEMMLIGTFCLFTLDLALGEKEGKGKRYLKWIIVILAVQIFLALATMGMTIFDNYIKWVISDGVWETQSFLVSAISLFYAFYSTVIMLLPTILSLLGGLWVYRQEKSIKAFTAVLVGLGASVIHQYIYGILLLPFAGGDTGTGMRAYPSLWISSGILATSLLLFYWIYRQKLDAKLKILLVTPDGMMDSFVKIPIFSSIIFSFLVSMLYTFGIFPMSSVWQSLLIYVCVFGSLVFIYGLMYWSIFRGITLSTETMKSRAELDVANHIQVSVLPNIFPAFPKRKEFSIYAMMSPAKEVGGDFYDFFFTDSNHLVMVIADVSGKGIPAALFMMTTRTLLKNLATAGEMPEEVLSKANNQLCENNETQMFVTVWIGILELSSGKLSFANAGHNPPLLKQGNETFTYLDHKTYKRSIMLGMRENIIYRRNEIQLKEKDVLLLYTDGVTEATNTENKLFGEHRLKSCVDENHQSQPEQLLPLLKTALDTFVGEAEQFDDITMLALELYAIPEVYETEVGQEHTAKVSEFVERFLEKNGASTKITRQGLIVVDEIFSNIVTYSNADKAIIRCLSTGNEITLSFEDNGKAFNPLDMKDPDITLPLEQREIGGLGILMVKKSMDNISYEYKDGCNILTLKKNIK